MMVSSSIGPEGTLGSLRHARRLKPMQLALFAVLALVICLVTFSAINQALRGEQRPQWKDSDYLPINPNPNIGLRNRLFYELFTSHEQRMRERPPKIVLPENSSQPSPSIPNLSLDRTDDQNANLSPSPYPATDGDAPEYSPARASRERSSHLLVESVVDYRLNPALLGRDQQAALNPRHRLAHLNLKPLPEEGEDGEGEPWQSLPAYYFLDKIVGNSPPAPDPPLYINTETGPPREVFMNGERFLMYARSDDWCASIGHWQWSLTCGLAEAMYLRRKWVMDMEFCLSPRFYPALEAPVARDIRLYYNMDWMDIPRADNGDAINRAKYGYRGIIEMSNFVAERDRFNRRFWDARVTAATADVATLADALRAANESVVLRAVREPPKVTYWYDVCNANPQLVRHWWTLRFAAHLEAVADQIKSALGHDFDALHIRHTDITGRNVVGFSGGKAARDGLSRSLRVVLPPGRRLYVATDETSQGFFDGLRDPAGSNFSIFRLADFSDAWSPRSEWFSLIQELLPPGVEPVFDPYMRAMVDLVVISNATRTIEKVADLKPKPPPPPPSPPPPPPKKVNAPGGARQQVPQSGRVQGAGVKSQASSKKEAVTGGKLQQVTQPAQKQGAGTGSKGTPSDSKGTVLRGAASKGQPGSSKGLQTGTVGAKTETKKWQSKPGEIKSQQQVKNSNA